VKLHTASDTAKAYEDGNALAIILTEGGYLKKGLEI